MNEQRVIKVNQSFQAMEFCDWEEAASLLVSGKGEGVGRTIKTINSPSTVLEIPEVIRLVNTSFFKMPDKDWETSVTTENILIRDNFVCAYCRGKATTRDHIIPTSKGGKNTWDNCIAACYTCNNIKDDKSLFEAGMKLLFDPKPLLSSRYDEYQRMQEELNQRLAAMSEV